MARRIHQARPGIPPHHVLATLEAFRAVLDMEPGIGPGYCPHCGRGDCSPTADQYEQQRQRAQHLASTLDDVLRRFVHKGHPGEPCLSSGWISEKTVARWREALYAPTRTETNCPRCPHPVHGDFCGVTEGINKCACTGNVIPV